MQTKRKLSRTITSVALMLCLSVSGIPDSVTASPTREPNAKDWKLWVLDRADRFRPPAPSKPGSPETMAELAELRTLQSQRNAGTNQKAAFWATGPASYRWTEHHLELIKKHKPNPPRGSRGLGLVHVAMYDAMVAAWDAKYAYHRPRPRQLDPNITEVVTAPPEWSYVSEHAALAGAASRVLAYLFPDEASELERLEREAAESRLWGGVNYPSDVRRGLELGHAVADLVIARAKEDNSNLVWDESGRLEQGENQETTITYSDTLEEDLGLHDGPDNGINGPHSGDPTYNINSYHIHTMLRIYINGTRVPIPLWGGGANFIHTHDASGAIHYHAGPEDGLPPPPNPHYVVIKEVFDAWRAASTNGNPNSHFTSTNLMNNLVDSNHVIQMWVNGTRVRALENYRVHDQDDIVVAYRTTSESVTTRPTGVCFWEPTPPAFTYPPLEPVWGKVKTWLMSAGDQMVPPPLPACDSDSYKEQVRQVMTTGANLTQEQKDIALRWAGGPGTETPPGQWNVIAQEMLLRDNVNTPRAARIMAYLNTVQADAFVCCWNAKYTYWSARPVTEIRRLFDPNWSPFIATPPFPAYTSGHATTSGAASEVLAHFFPSDAERMRALAREAAISRLYGGIHIAADNDEGLVLGQGIAHMAAERAKSDGADTPAQNLARTEPGKTFAYPNPAKHGQWPAIHVEADAADKIQLRIFDSAGDPVQQVDHVEGPISSWDYFWDVSQVASGVYTYIVSIHSRGDVSSKRGKVAVIK